MSAIVPVFFSLPVKRHWFMYKSIAFHYEEVTDKAIDSLTYKTTSLRSMTCGWGFNRFRACTSRNLFT